VAGPAGSAGSAGSELRIYLHTYKSIGFLVTLRSRISGGDMAAVGVYDRADGARVAEVADSDISTAGRDLK
jgi:hypothetical protein